MIRIIKNQYKQNLKICVTRVSTTLLTGVKILLISINGSEKENFK